MAQIATERSGIVAPAIADPAPLGLSAFALTTFVLTSTYAGFFPAGAGSVAVAVALFYGGVALLFAGMWGFRRGNTLSAAALSSSGAFLLFFSSISLPGICILPPPT